ncbi:uncharacterized protein LOC125947103 [Dermacentor silvarum]|uniref:uncharacterized protein LOC125947103 n=1 Tax=Dermacentor silvarum TaxID=543639 RepID=UPI0021010C65|nr:uncharacterized protein LOC125947103 [Dermacentor silvarum]
MPSNQRFLFLEQVRAGGGGGGDSSKTVYLIGGIVLLLLLMGLVYLVGFSGSSAVEPTGGEDGLGGGGDPPAYVKPPPTTTKVAPTGTATHTGVTSRSPPGPSPPKSSSPKPLLPKPAPPPPPLLVTSHILACTVGHESVLIDMVPPDGTCDIIFYTDVFFNDKKNRIEPLYGDTAFKVVRSVAASYTKTTFGTSMHPGTIGQFIHDKSKNIENAMAKLLTDRFVHFGMLNVDIDDASLRKDGPLMYLSIVENFQTTPGYHRALGLGLNNALLGPVLNYIIQ